MSSQQNSPSVSTKKDLPAEEAASRGGKSKAQIRAENRERQEKQRAAKASASASKSAGGGGDPGGSKSSGSVKPKPAKKPAAQRTEEASERRGSLISAQEQAQSTVADVENKIRDLRIFSHFGARGHLGQKIKGEIHPSILRLGLLFAEYKITGANARCIAALTAFKTVVADYTTPTNNTLSRHIMTYLSPQISYLTSARPMSVSLGNAIRSLKVQISNIGLDLSEHAAKSELYSRIDQYLQERIIAADIAISTFGMAKIHDGDVVLTYARSSVVEKLLISAHRAGKRFEVIVVDSRPMLEGKNLLRTLVAVGIPCTYCILSALGTIMNSASIVFLGTHALHSNGALYSRAGTALVAMMAKQHNVPVLACCETYKFSDSVNLDSFTKNELVSSAEMAGKAPVTRTTSTTPIDDFNLQLLNPLYDLTPPAYITAVVTEVGLIPVSSVPTVLSRETQA
ncbi:eukaryotic translation initiation factor 2B delta subunit [Ceratobasidium sp. AG-I]|nr:eukaryotic translation initiation factor 2B delta subunit [Ceratobasidium sp. AG-I]